MIDLIAYAALVVVAGFLLPVVKRSMENHAWHNSVYCKLPYDNVTENAGQSAAGRRAQELGETRFQNLVGLVLASPLLFVLDFEGRSLAALIAAVVVMAITYKILWFDDIGHGAEILVAEREGREGYREAEINRMLRDPARKGWNAEEVGKRLDRWRFVSRLLVVLAR